MTALLRLLPYLIVGLLLAAAVWWIRDQGYRVGYADGDRVGFRRGIEQAQKTHDASMRILLAESRAQAEQARRVASEAVEQEKRRYEAEIASARETAAGDLAAAVAHRDRLLARLRAAGARDPVRPADDRGGLPRATDPAGPGAPPAAGAFPGPDRAELVRIAFDADALSAQYAICYRYADAVRRHTNSAHREP